MTNRKDNLTLSSRRGLRSDVTMGWTIEGKPRIKGQKGESVLEEKGEKQLDTGAKETIEKRRQGVGMTR